MIVTGIDSESVGSMSAFSMISNAHTQNVLNLSFWSPFEEKIKKYINKKHKF